MWFYLFLQSQDSWAAFVQPVITTLAGTIAGGLVTYSFTRKKTNSEADKNYHQIALEVSNGMADLLDDLEKSKEKYAETLIEFSSAKIKLQELEARCDRQERENLDQWQEIATYKTVLREMRALITNLETALKDIIEHAPLLKDAEALKAKLSELKLA